MCLLTGTIRVSLDKSDTSISEFHACAASPRAEAVSLVEGMRDTKVMEYNKTYLWCRFAGSPPPKITWLKDGRLLRRSTRLQVHDAGGTSALLIPRSFQSDTGNYTCSAQQGGLTPVNSTAHLRVLPSTWTLPIDYPQLTRQPERKTFEITSIVQVDCAIRSVRLQPHVVWFRNQTPLALGESRYSLGGSSPNDFTLKITNAGENDTGEYECAAWTPLDGHLVVSSSAWIFVKGSHCTSFLIY